MSAELIFVLGPGGVGKTTTSAVIALEAAARGQRVALITVDPARRLAQALGQERLPHRPEPVPGVDGLDAAMIDRSEAWAHVLAQCISEAASLSALKSNRYFQSLVSEFPGSLEYVASDVIVGLVAEADYDLVVVDTPPATDALAFLDAPRRLGKVFDGEFLRLLRGGGGIMSRAARRGGGVIRKVLATFVGEATMEELAGFLQLMQEVLAYMRERSRRMRALQYRPETRFVLVGAADTAQLGDLETFRNQLSQRDLSLHALVVNRLIAEPPDEASCRKAAAGTGLEEWATRHQSLIAGEAARQRRRVAEKTRWAEGLPRYTVPCLTLEPRCLEDLARLMPHLAQPTASPLETMIP